MAVLSDLTSSRAKHRVFISYSHDSASHRDAVKMLADTIGSLPEIDCVLDQYVPGEHPIEGWPRWMEQQFELSTRVLCICTKRYFRLLSNDATTPSNEGRGAHWESELFLAELYREKSTSKKLKAVLLDGDDADKCVPAWLQKWGWLLFPRSKQDLPFTKLVAYLTDAAPVIGSGLPDSTGGPARLSDLEQSYVDWQRRDTISSVENVKVLGMTKPIRLVDLYYPVVLSTTIARRLYESEWKKATDNGGDASKAQGIRRKAALASFVKGAEFVDENRRVVVLGGPGAGKTTFLRSLALKYCGGTTDAAPADGFAIFVHLPTAAKASIGLAEWIDSRASQCGANHAGCFGGLARKVPTTILLDSLDEVPSAVRADMLERINLLERQFPEVRIVISCRTADYQENLEHFVDVEIARLSSDAIAKIVAAWFFDDVQNGERLLSLIATDDGVRSLTETPLLLSLLCIQFRHDLDLPKRRVELYSRCVSALLRDWDAGRSFRRTSKYELLTDDRKVKLFESLAGHFMGSGERFDFPVVEAHGVVGGFIERCNMSAHEAEEVLLEIEKLHGIVERLSRDHYCFSHNTFQEYFAACRILGLRDESRIVQTHLMDESWESVIEFIAGLMDDPYPVFQQLMKASVVSGLSNYPALAKRTRVLTLLYRCLCSSPLLTPGQRAEVAKHLVEAHFHIAAVYGRGGVYPFATLRTEGVTHTFLWTSKRPTLAEALKPFRRLANLIYQYPGKEFGEAVLQAVESKQWEDDLAEKFGPSIAGLVGDTLTVSLLVPISRAYPTKVIQRLEAIVERSKMAFVKNSVGETVRQIAAKHGVA